MLVNFISQIPGFIEDVWDSNFKFVLVVALAPILQLIIKLVTPFLVKIFLAGSGIAGFGTKRGDKAAKKRIKTLAGVAEATTFVLIIIGVILFIFTEVGLDITPIIAGAGVLSLAVGFGAQSLVKDIISGIFIILENQFNKGDWVQIGKYGGRVVEVNLRRTILQTISGARHIIPNSKVVIVTNNTNQYSAISLIIPTKINADFKKVNRLINEVCRELAQDSEFEKNIIEAPETIGVDEINEYAALIRVWGKVKPGKHIKAKRELAKRIAEKFAQNKIKLPGKIIA